MVIRQVGVASAAKVCGALYALFGFLFGLLMAFLAVVGSGLGAAAGDDAFPSWIGGLFGVGAVIFLPIVYGVLGAIGGALTAVFYNVVAGMVGGIQIDTE
jgi:hypothetical protein